MARKWLMVICNAAFLMGLQGCNPEQEKQVSSGTEPAVAERGKENVVVNPSILTPVLPPTSVVCDDRTESSAASRGWCQGFTVWKASGFFVEGNPQKRDMFINSYQLGQQDAAMANNLETQKYQNQPLALAGYQSGYEAVIRSQGLVRYACDIDSDNEYQDRWCEAAGAYRNHQLGTPYNPILEARYIAGYMAGRAVALTIPTGMDLMFRGEVRAGSRKAITEPNRSKNRAESAFFQGFEEGDRAMAAMIQDSMHQLMEQMPEGIEVVPNIPGMEGKLKAPGNILPESGA